ncbi:unnamed protein product [Orchesella dallaii]|uniref:DUF243 domain-containing protein n=1 Tax=Orchesella dallaii TaxID=48710 RepID=A0ABP1RFN4_9HEXA
MKIFLTFVSAIALATAESPTQGGYSGGGGSFPAGGSFNFGNGGYTTGFGASGGDSFGAGAGGYSGPAAGAGGFNGAGGAEQAQGPQVFKYVSVHSAPEDPEDQATKQVRVPGGGNKHVNIIFVKSPSNGADQKTEIVLPEQDEQKSLVYVLVQKTDVAANLKIQRPQPTKPSKPEVYFIRYKNAAQEQAGANGAGAVGVGGDFRGTSGPANVPSAAYGAP